MKAKFPQKKDFEIAAMLGVSPQAFANWGRNDGVVRLPNAETLYLGYKLLGMMMNELEAGAEDQSATQPLDWPVLGMAAADDSTDICRPLTGEPTGVVRCPSSLALVPVKGDSMAPLILSGNYVMIDYSREGFEVDGDVVVTTIVDPDWERHEKMPGTFVKRCFKRDEKYYWFTSVNSVFPPFCAWQENCRVWPILGVWRNVETVSRR